MEYPEQWLLELWSLGSALPCPGTFRDAARHQGFTGIAMATVWDNTLSQFSAADLERIQQSTFVERVEYHREIDSTNNRALALVGESRIGSASLILTDRQTGGRGRGQNRWWAGPGALTFSLLINTGSWDLPPQRLPLASLTVGLAVCEAIEDVVDLPELRIKWPNDIYIGMRKVGGILIELPPGVPETLVIGIGINVNNSAREAPPDLQASIISLCDAAERPLPVLEILQQILNRLQRRLPAIAPDGVQQLADWRRRCLLTNRSVCLALPARQIVGICRGIDGDGALLIETERGVERCFGGTVTKM